MTSISASLVTQTLYTRIDTNADGCVTKDEFVSGRPGDVSETQASAFFDGLDADSSGDVSQTELSDGLAAKASDDATSTGGTLSSGMLGAVLALTQQDPAAGDTPASCGNGGGGDCSDEKVYDPLDTNKDGVVDLQELKAALGNEDAGGAGGNEDDLTSLLRQQAGTAARAYCAQASATAGLSTSLLIDA